MANTGFHGKGLDVLVANVSTGPTSTRVGVIIPCDHPNGQSVLITVGDAVTFGKPNASPIVVIETTKDGAAILARALLKLVGEVPNG